MPNLTKMKALLEDAKAAYKAQFTGGFYHGSPSPNIRSFDSSKGAKDFPTGGVTFVTRDPDFADSFLPMNRNGEYEKGATMYPVNVDLGKHFVPSSKEGTDFINDYVASLPANPDAAVSNAKRAAALKSGAWDVMEDPTFLNRLKAKDYDTFQVMEGGVNNVGVFDPSRIRGKFAAFNPEDAASPEIMKASGGVIKELAHAVSIPFTHFSPKADLTTLDPRKYGTGMKGAEAARLANAADIAPRSYFYHGESIVPESGVGGNKYTGVSQNSYPISKDPGDFYTKSRTNDPYLMQMGITQHSPEHTINNMERLIKDAGYSGYHTDTGTGVLFNNTPVIKAQQLLSVTLIDPTLRSKRKVGSPRWWCRHNLHDVR